ncbi:MAG: radical SAM protein, partial [Oscillospiraceae bacterium]|nr:radical SAM protein [Oscillospiraceae bacterium]
MQDKTVCSLCPRKCSAERTASAGGGVCGMGLNPVLARAALHEWEEPCVSGERGSGAVFFSGCTLRCAYCQNYSISHGRFGKEITPTRLREIYFELINKGAHNINLVNPTHFADAILESLEGGLPVPVVFNSSGYELPETLCRFEGKVNVWLPDLKYADDLLAAKYSRAPDYFETAKRAIREMFRQTGPYELDGDGMITRGVIIRHLILPG